MRTKLILLGAPGCGKGTQAKLIAKEFKFPHISTGDILREAVKNKTELGVKAASYMEKGELVPDDVVIGIVKERLSQDDCKQGFILDGFPRTLAQAEALKDYGIDVDVAIFIDVPEEKIVERITGRRVCEKCGAMFHIKFNPPKVEGVCDNCGGKLYQRKDDTEEVVKERLKTYAKNTLPLLDFYKKIDKLITLDGNRSIENIFSDIVKIIEEG